jgi:hypothetical protein
MELLPVLLLLTQTLTPAPVATRIIEPTGAPVTLVGLPCGDAKKKVLVEKSPETESKAYLRSRVFACDKECAVGIRVKDGVHISSLAIATASAHDQGRLTGTLSPALVPTVFESCNGESYVIAVLSKVAWPTAEGIIYVTDVTFQDGTRWHVDRDSLENDVLKAWIIQPKHGQ